jgi:hypothetical protein
MPTAARREALADELGIDPTPALRQLERAILNQEPSLDFEPAVLPLSHSLLVVARDERSVDGLIAIAERLAGLPDRELVVAILLDEPGDLAGVAARLNSRREGLDVSARVAVFTTSDPAEDVVRLATTNDVELVLMKAPPGLDGKQFADDVATMIDRSPADVAFLHGPVDLGSGARIFVPFGGGEHDWAALELAAWLSRATSKPLTLVGTRADPRHDRRDASRLLADSSLAVQRVVGVEAEPLLAEPSEEGLLRAVDAATIVVVGVSERWRRDGIGDSRRALVRRARPPIVLVHRGRRPGGLAPQERRGHGSAGRSRPLTCRPSRAP